MQVLYLATSGTSDATRASIPLHLAANGSLEAGQTAAVVLAGDAAELIIGDNADRIEGIGLPPMRDLVGKLRDHEVPVYVWKACAVARGATDDSLAVVNGSWATPTDVARLIGDADRVVSL